LPGKIEKAVQYALDECFLELVGTPEAQRDKWVYKEIKARIREAMQEWIKEAMDEAIEEALKK
jgi:diphthamide synthase subunit DPH2